MSGEISQEEPLSEAWRNHLLQHSSPVCSCDAIDREPELAINSKSAQDAIRLRPNSPNSGQQLQLVCGVVKDETQAVRFPSAG